MSGPVDRFLSVFTLVSRIPVPVRFVFDPSRMDFWLPVVGLPAAAAAAAAAFGGSSLFGEPVLAALCVVGVQYFAFNLFHLDGLLDTADAFLGTADAEKRKAILKDPRIGTYALFGGFLHLCVKTALLAALLRPLAFGTDASGIRRILAPLCAYALSGRLAAAVLPALHPPAGGGGLGALAAGSSLRRCILGYGTALLLWMGLFVALGLRPAPSDILGWALPPLGALAASLLVGRIYRRGLGGYTGDALGSAVELGESAHLLTLFLILR